MKPETKKTTAGPWDNALDILREWDEQWTNNCVKMSTNPWNNSVLSIKFIELVSIAVNASCTNLNSDGTTRHIQAALDAGATREEILFVIKCAMLPSIHTCSLSAPILLEEAAAAGIKPLPKNVPSTPNCDKMKEIGQWNMAWDPFFELDPLWTEEFIATGVAIYSAAIFTPKELELISIALDASFTHMYAPGVRRHIKAALKEGATMEEIMEVLKLCVIQGVQALNLGVPILAKELNRKTKGS